MKLYDLLVSAQKGDEEATLSIFLKFNKAIKKMSRKLNYEEAETDLIIAFLEMIQEIDLNKISMKGDGGVVNYIYFFLKHKSVDLFRKNISQKIENTELNLDIIADDKHSSIDNQIFVSMLLNSLPPLQKTVLERKFMEGFSDEEIGASYGISRQAVNRAKNRALKNLRKKLEDMEERKQWKKKYLN